MPHISIISSSVRKGRRSHRVALYFKNYLTENGLASVEILDLLEYNFPLFDERIKFQTNPTAKTLELVDKIKATDGILIVTPEYNGGYPASLKNVIDMLDETLNHKTIAISTVSEGSFGGTQVITSLQFSVWKMHALVVPAMFPVPKVQDNFDEQGKPVDKEKTDKRASKFISELLNCMQANKSLQKPVPQPKM